MDYKDIYIKLKEQDKSLTEERFSTDYLGMSKHYISMCKARKVGISDKAVLRLWRNLKGLSKLWLQIETDNEARVSVRAKAKAGYYEELAEMVLLTALNKAKIAA